MGAKKKGKKKKAPQIGFGFGGGPRMYIPTNIYIYLKWCLFKMRKQNNFHTYIKERSTKLYFIHTFKFKIRNIRLF